MRLAPDIINRNPLNTYPTNVHKNEIIFYWLLQPLSGLICMLLLRARCILYFQSRNFEGKSSGRGGPGGGGPAARTNMHIVAIGKVYC